MCDFFMALFLLFLRVCCSCNVVDRLSLLFVIHVVLVFVVSVIPFLMGTCDHVAQVGLFPAVSTLQLFL